MTVAYLGTDEIVVYKATNLTNGDYYIGCTKNGLAAREWQHRNRANKPRKTKLHEALNQFGDAAFVFESLFVFEDIELALAYEAEMVAAHRPAYNVAAGGRKKVAAPAQILPDGDTRNKPVRCLNDGNIYTSAVEAGHHYRLKGRHVANAASATARGVYRTHHGLRFEYVRKQ